MKGRDSIRLALAASCLALSARAQSQAFEHRWAGYVQDAFMSPDGSRIWTVEDGGRIRHRDPSGSWSFQPTPFRVQDVLHRVHFIDNAVGWAVGQDGWFLKTTNGGQSWQALFQMNGVLGAEENEELYDVHFLDVNSGWLVGLHGIWYTTTGGNTEASWIPATLLDANGELLEMTPQIELYAIDVVDRGSSRLALATSEPGFVLRNVDAAATQFQVVWSVYGMCASGVLTGCERTLCAPDPSTFEPWDVEISRNSSPSMKLALIVGGAGSAQCGLVFSSTDDGTTWVKDYHECQLPGDPCANDPLLLYHDNPAVPTHTWRHQSFKGLYGVGLMSGDNTAVAAGYNGQHVVRNPSNGVWRDVSKFSTRPVEATTAVVFPLYGAAAYSGTSLNGKAVLTGTGGQIRRSIDGGSTWSNETVGAPWRISSVCFTSDSSGWQIGQFFRIGRSSDGGLTWTAQNPLPVLGTGALSAIAFSADGLNGVAVGESDTRSTSARQDHPKILYTTDTAPAVTNWSEPTSVTEVPGTNSLLKSLRAVTWVVGRTFWAAGDAGLIYFTRDGGDTWNQYYDARGSVRAFQRLQFTGLSFRDFDNGVFVGYDQVNPTVARAWSYKSTNDSTLWTEITATDTSVTKLADVEVRGNTAYAVGERSVNGVRVGVVLVSQYSAGAFGPFTSMTPQPTASACTVGFDLNTVAVLNRIAINPSNGDLWVGGECGRVWHFTNGAWIQRKSQTSAHVYGMSATPGGYVYLGCMRHDNTQQCIVRWHP
jgi:photosystem II stability/assembly factor-like uncharacterized protein